MADSVPPGFPQNVRLIRSWRAFVGPRLWTRLCASLPPKPFILIDALWKYVERARGRVTRSVLAVMSAAARCCEAQKDDRIQRAFAALFDACVELLPLTSTEPWHPEITHWCAWLDEHGYHAVRFPADRIHECPVSVVWAFRDAFMMGPMRSGGSAAPGAAPPAPPPPPPPPAATRETGETGPRRACEHVPVPVTPAAYEGYERQDAVFALLHKGWPHKLQPRETQRLVSTLLLSAVPMDAGAARAKIAKDARAREAEHRMMNEFMRQPRAGVGDAAAPSGASDLALRLKRNDDNLKELLARVPRSCVGDDNLGELLKQLRRPRAGGDDSDGDDDDDDRGGEEHTEEIVKRAKRALAKKREKRALLRYDTDSVRAHDGNESTEKDEDDTDEDEDPPPSSTRRRGGNGAHPSTDAAHRRALARRAPLARECLCRWWAYARLGRWPGDVPLMNWGERIALVKAVDVAGRDQPPEGVPKRTEDTFNVDVEWNGAVDWCARILMRRPQSRACAPAVRAQCVTGVTLAMQAVIIESVRRLAPFRVYLCIHSRWEDFERASTQARNAWRAAGGLNPVPAFFSDLMAMASRDTDANMWLIHVGRCLRSRGITAAPIPDDVKDAFSIGIAALADLARLVWPLVIATRRVALGLAVTAGGPTAYEDRQVQAYVGRMDASGNVRSEWDTRIPAVTICHAIALSEVVRATLAACGVDDGGCSAVFHAIRDLYVCTTGPRVQANALIRSLERTRPQIMALLVALHNVCVDRMVLQTTPLDAYTTSMQIRACAARTGLLSGGRGDWLAVCHECAWPHTIVSKFDTAPTPGRAVGVTVAPSRHSRVHQYFHLLSATEFANTKPPEPRGRARGAKPAAVSAGMPPLPAPPEHGFEDVSVDTHNLTYVCNADRSNGARVRIYPVHLTGVMAWFQSRCFTICPQCGVAAQINPQRCAYVNFTFSCARCTARVNQQRYRLTDKAGDTTIASAAVPAVVSKRKRRKHTAAGDD